MGQHQVSEPDFGTGKKKLGVYLIGFLICSLLTLIAFWAVVSATYTKRETFLIIYSAACLQFFVQLIFFIRLNTETKQGRTNIMSFIFTLVILTSVILGSLWIMWNLNYNMMH